MYIVTVIWQKFKKIYICCFRSYCNSENNTYTMCFIRQRYCFGYSIALNRYLATFFVSYLLYVVYNVLYPQKIWKKSDFGCHLLGLSLPPQLNSTISFFWQFIWRQHKRAVTAPITDGPRVLLCDWLNSHTKENLGFSVFFLTLR